MQITQTTTCEKRRTAKVRGFTIFELMAVVAIIVILIAILVPTLGKARTKAREAATRALMSNLSSDIESYYTTFHAYPGPFPALGGTSTTAASAANKISGAQNMLLGLSYAMTLSSATPTAKPIGNMFVDPSRVTGPLNYAVVRPDGSYEQLSPFFSPSIKQLSTPNKTPVNTWPAGGVTGSNSAAFAFPVAIDTFPDGMPILYYRRSPGIGSPISPATSVVAPTGSTAPAAYYWDENKEYTKNGVTLTASSGTAITQNGLFTEVELAEIVQNGTGASATAKGGYLLMSAGADSVYGKVNGKLDDLTMIGGN